MAITHEMIKKLRDVTSAGMMDCKHALEETGGSLDAAVDTLQHAFEVNPQDALAHYNMACYRAVQQRKPEALELLKNALHLDPKLKALARAEPDFADLRGTPAFQQVLNGR